MKVSNQALKNGLWIPLAAVLCLIGIMLFGGVKRNTNFVKINKALSNEDGGSDLAALELDGQTAAISAFASYSVLQGETEDARMLLSTLDSAEQEAMSWGAKAELDASWNVAREWYQIALDQNDSNGVAWLGLANSLNNLNHLDEAFLAYTNAVEHAGTVCDSWYGLGRWYINAEQFEDAFTSFESGLNATEEICLVGESQLHFQLGFIQHYFSDERNFADALERYQTALEVDDFGVDLSERAPVYQHQAAALFRLERYEEALESAETAIAIRPSQFGAYRIIANSYRELGKLDEAEIAIRSSIDASNNPRIGDLIVLANILIDQKNYTEAEAILNRASRINQNNPSLKETIERLNQER